VPRSPSAARPGPRALLLAVVCLLGGLAGCGQHSGPPAGPPGAAVVVRPVDGDTVIVRIGHTTTSVRLIGIDTPESVSRVTPVECYGPEAKHRTAELLPPGTAVLLQRDVEARDKYDRLLAYVTRASDGTFINLLLVEEGFAASFRFPPNTAHEADFEHAEAAAKADERGLWPACGGTDTPIGPVASAG
jgi:micrococcal nuclease